MHPTSAPSAHTAKQVAVLRKQALAYPETREDFPWGHSAFKVKGKAFAFLHADGEGFSISVKLPDSNALALHLPFAEPTGYGLGKSGWVTGRFARDQVAPIPVLSAWLEESFTAVAPKRLVAAFLAGESGARPTVPSKGGGKRKAGAVAARGSARGQKKTRVGAAKVPTRKAAAKQRAAPAARKLAAKKKKRASARAK